jgi:hypothetical protein
MTKPHIKRHINAGWEKVPDDEVPAHLSPPPPTKPPLWPVPKMLDPANGTEQGGLVLYRLTADKIEDAHRIDRLCMVIICSLGYRAFRLSVEQRIDECQIDRERWDEAMWWQEVLIRLDELEEGMRR